MSNLSPEHETLRRETRRFAEKSVAPIAQELYNQQAEIPMEIIRQMADLGFLSP